MRDKSTNSRITCLLSSLFVAALACYGGTPQILEVNLGQVYIDRYDSRIDLLPTW